MVAGEIAYRRDHFDAAFQHLRTAIKRDDAMNYDEPWGWMQPARHAMGALLIEQGHFEQAEKVYRADLKRHPKNPWSLNGLAECLMELGKADEAAVIRKQFLSATERADVKIDRSCFCRLE
jgi:tetratricopeptide (TPR) repeat protein